MSVFRYDEKAEAFVAEIDGIRFWCDEVEDGYEDEAKTIANAYRERLPELVSYMLPELCFTVIAVMILTKTPAFRRVLNKN